jgi:hypothetical protein
LYLFLSLSDGRWKQPVPFFLYGIVGLLACAYAALDEWHQSFVPGRFAGVGDFLLDCVGVVGLLLIHHMNSLKNRRVSEGEKASNGASRSNLHPTPDPLHPNSTLNT